VLVLQLWQWQNIMYYIFWVCVSTASVMQDATRMRRITLSYLAWPALPNFFPHYLINGMTFGENVEHKMSVLIFCTTSVWNISHSKNNSAIFTYLLTYSMVHSPSWEANWFCSQSRNSPHFMEPESSSPYSQVRDIIINVYRSSSKVLVILIRF